MFCVFVGCLPGITRPGYFLRGLRRSYNAAGGRATLSCPPGPRLTIAKLWYCIHCLQLFTVSYNVLHCSNDLEPELPGLGLIYSAERLKSHHPRLAPWHGSNHKK
jgi:hypothetical protein